MSERPRTALELEEELDRLRRDCNTLLDEAAKVIIGQETVLRLMLAAIFARGHCLLVGVPGLAKTMMVRALAGALDLEFRRIQFTPDLMPSDITGSSIIQEDEDRRRRFEFVKGPLFANVILADEINRTPPKTQAALLEAMQERQVTCTQRTYPLPEPFFVIATQNPIEQEGTYELPEAQLDRFMFNVQVNYPSLAEEEKILAATTGALWAATSPVISARRFLEIQRLVQSVHVSNYMVSYVARLVRSSRPEDDYAPDYVRAMVTWGAGPRAGQYLILGGKALAAMDGRPTVAPEDVRAVALPVLRHRLQPNFQAQAEGIDSVRIIEELLQKTPEPKA